MNLRVLEVHLPLLTLTFETKDLLQCAGNTNKKSHLYWNQYNII